MTLHGTDWYVACTFTRVLKPPGISISNFNSCAFHIVVPLGVFFKKKHKKDGLTTYVVWAFGWQCHLHVVSV